jgi:hypothetical protein
MWDQILRALQKKKEEEAALAAEPSLMDEWIEKNDPAQYKKIQEARLAQEIPSLAIGSVSNIGIKNKNIGKFEKAAQVVDDYFKANDYFPMGEYEQFPQFIKSQFVKGSENIPITKAKIIKEVMDNPEYLNAMEESIKPLNKRYEATLMRDPRQRQLENIASWQDLIKLQAMQGAEPIGAQQIKQMMKK